MQGHCVGECMMFRMFDGWCTYIVQVGHLIMLEDKPRFVALHLPVSFNIQCA